MSEELDSLNERLLPMRAPYQAFSLMDLPVFMADPHDLEARQVREKFINERKKIIDVYQHGNFLETTLERLNS